MILGNVFSLSNIKIFIFQVLKILKTLPKITIKYILHIKCLKKNHL